MERIEVLSAVHPRHYAADPDSITLDVRFSHLPEPVQFTARKDDPMEHGRELYSRAAFGEFGDIEVIPLPPPTEAEQQARLNTLLKQAATAMAPLEDAEKLGILSDEERVQLTAWQHYRVTLYRLPQSDGWPTKVTWPDVPSA
ncbi:MULTISPECIES: tail fiber assembly protein [Aeromonas]|uniref:tail fiber assembly protein n=1 Tax=Aeromonas TaxID=642 RepID=UPI000CDE1615|nr:MULTISPECIES: tail fiber assembly protein [Aeromonas]AUZ76220.1 phage tail protein [Aeromonas sp. ASNIH4]AUZ77134.1 phage tail protein [Aeromonas sp. ASNIH4]POU26585.1 phage tail protein [Aeromonas hydrophila]POV84808.1 phage tail protein [Aeromonas sp. ASNIH6]